MPVHVQSMLITIQHPQQTLCDFATGMQTPARVRWNPWLHHPTCLSHLTHPNDLTPPLVIAWNSIIVI